ncbi:MAG: transposase [Propionibacteriaceae bacterium]|nr:transposase [Propionibacteriaceae bacterium]
MQGRQFVLTTRRQNWGEDRVMYFNEAGRLRSIPTTWTNVAADDPFQCASDGRSWFRVDDLLALVSQVQTLKSAQRKPVK